MVKLFTIRVMEEQVTIRPDQLRPASLCQVNMFWPRIFRRPLLLFFVLQLYPITAGCAHHLSFFLWRCVRCQFYFPHNRPLKIHRHDCVATSEDFHTLHLSSVSLMQKLNSFVACSNVWQTKRAVFEWKPVGQNAFLMALLAAQTHTLLEKMTLSPTLFKVSSSLGWILFLSQSLMFVKALRCILVLKSLSTVALQDELSVCVSVCKYTDEVIIDFIK